MTAEHRRDECLVTWPTDPTQGDLIPDSVRPHHSCKLLAVHVRTHDGVQRTTVTGELLPPASVIPHLCHCGAWTPVRDAEIVGELPR